MVLLREEILKDVISEVFETMFFMDVAFEECQGAGRAFEYESETRLENNEGCLVVAMRIGEKFARMISANFMGIDEARTKDVDEDELVDCLRELSNMVAGGCHAHAGDSDWKLGIPRAWTTASGHGDATGEVFHLCFTFSGEPAGSAALRYLPG
ncbi:MAG: chemotaxis protein CheX [Syntrophobacteraceae bacterium]|nr:chemotaxis protein CheX [Syntrophobacteraceae bacterium]